MTKLFESYQKVPQEMLKRVDNGGRTYNSVDVSFRLKSLNDAFGDFGKGWGFRIVERWIDTLATDEKIANLQVEFWHTDASPVHVIGSTYLVRNTRKNGLMSDEDAWKKSLTDAISVWCRNLGIALDAYSDDGVPQQSESTTPGTDKVKKDEDDRAWLNIWVDYKTKDEINEFGMKVAKALTSGERSWDDLNKKYKMTRDSREALEAKIAELKGGAPF